MRSEGTARRPCGSSRPCPVARTADSVEAWSQSRPASPHSVPECSTEGIVATRNMHPGDRDNVAGVRARHALVSWAGLAVHRAARADSAIAPRDRWRRSGEYRCDVCDAFALRHIAGDRAQRNRAECDSVLRRSTKADGKQAGSYAAPRSSLGGWGPSRVASRVPAGSTAEGCAVAVPRSAPSRDRNCCGAVT